MPPSDDELLEVLRGCFDQPVRSLVRTPYRYATSHAIEELVATCDTYAVNLLFKDLGGDALLPEAAHVKPVFLQAPEREIDTYRLLLAPSGIGARCHAAIADTGRQWLFLEKVGGVELWQVGDHTVWLAVADWLAGFHDRFRGRSDEVRSVNPRLLRRDDADFEEWRHRALDALERCPDPRAPVATDLLRTVAVEHRGEPCFVHGELYPSNVLVEDGRHGVRVFPIDWEMAATGPAEFDLAALVTGWDEDMRGRLVERYRGALESPPPAADLFAAVDLCRVHLAAQWLGWMPGWQAPTEHAHDWIGELLDVGGRYRR